MPAIELEMIGFEGGHLHIVMAIPLKYTTTDVMGKLKANRRPV